MPVAHNGLPEEKKKDMVSTIYHNKSKGSDAQNYLSNSSTVLEIKKFCSYASVFQKLKQNKMYVETHSTTSRNLMKLQN